MSDPTPPAPDLSRPVPPRTWRDHLAEAAGGLDLSTGRLLAGAAVLGVTAVLCWRLLAPPAPAAEMQLPYARPPAAAAAPSDTGPAGGSGPGEGPATAPDGGGGGAGEQVVVHVAGAVAGPGVQRLAAGSRVIDAVDAAGGLAVDADPSRLNLAAELVDGQQVYVVRVGEVAPALAAGGGGPDGGPQPVIDLNTASAADLEELPGVGPATAEAIVDHREQHGPFTSVDSLLDVRGIGDAKLAELRERVVV
jgi:competence protein ComEA